MGLRHQHDSDTYSIGAHALPHVLHALDRVVLRQDVDDAQIIYSLEPRVRLVRRAQPTIVLIKQEVLPVACVFLGERDTCASSAQLLEVGLADNAASEDCVWREWTSKRGGFAPQLGYLGLCSAKCDKRE